MATLINTADHQADQLWTNTFWNDLRVSQSFKLGGGNDPNLVQFLSGGYFYCFDTNDELGFNTQLPHEWKIGTDLEFHVHWTPHSRGVAENGNTVTWAADVSIIGIDGTFPVVSNYSDTDTCDGVDNKHLLIDIGTVPGSALTLSSVITGRVYKSGGTWSGTGNNGPMLLELDLHYEIDRPGSRWEYTK
jgi:opacity protein-like surface antigen